MQIKRQTDGQEQMLVKGVGWIDAHPENRADHPNSRTDYWRRLAEADSGEPFNITTKKYGPRTWAVYVIEELLCVTVYKKGAEAVGGMLDQLWHRIQDDGKLRMVA